MAVRTSATFGAVSIYSFSVFDKSGLSHMQKGECTEHQEPGFSGDV